MCILKGIANLRSDPGQIIERERPLLQSRLERPAGDVFHDEEVHAVLGVEIENRRHAGVGQPGQGVRLTAEALARRRVRERAAQQHLDRNVAVEVQIVRSVHLTHAAGAERLENAVVRKLLTDIDSTAS